jgi:hypothetical protein
VTAAPGRRGDLDWLRGIAVLITIEAHALDAWTRLADRSRPEFTWARTIVGSARLRSSFLRAWRWRSPPGRACGKGAAVGQAAALARRMADCRPRFLFRNASPHHEGHEVYEGHEAPCWSCRRPLTRWAASGGRSGGLRVVRPSCFERLARFSIE